MSVVVVVEFAAVACAVRVVVGEHHHAVGFRADVEARFRALFVRDIKDEILNAVEFFVRSEIEG